jgi:hypothetical protein
LEVLAAWQEDYVRAPSRPQQPVPPLFVNGEQALDVSTVLGPSDEMDIVQTPSVG